MAINLCCPVCYKTYKLQTLECKCGNNLRRSKLFKVRVKRPDGKWRSKQVNSLELAKKVEAKFKTQAIEEDVFDIHRAPVIDAVWKKYIHWASLNKRSWIDDRIRWELHTRHQFSVAEARKPEACGSCHLGGDHPQLEIYEASKHGQLYNAHGEDWNFEAAPDTWEPGDYDAPTCAVCHMSGIGELSYSHNVTERLKWNLHAPRSEVRTGERGDGVKGEKLMRQVCSSCHSSLHTDVQREVLDETVTLYNVYWDKAAEMEKELADKNLLGKDNWNDGFQELKLHLYHFSGRRARMGTAMPGPTQVNIIGSL